MSPGAWRHFVLVAAVLACAAAALSQPPIAQPLDYHQFADTRTLLGVPNAVNVLSNIPFAIVGVAGLLVTSSMRDVVARRSYLVLFAGVALTAIGSGYYHLAPDNARLVWDRLPMTIGFAGLLTGVLAERVSARAARALLWPLVAAACGTVVYWHWSELRGAGDLRPYLLVQFGSLAVVLLVLALYRSPRPGTAWLVAGLAAYAAAKGLETADRAIFDAGHVVSGHSLKHLVAAAGVACVGVMTGFRASHPVPRSERLR